MTLYLLDTDHISLAQRGHSHVIARIVSTPSEQLIVSIVTAQEQLRGRLAQVQQASSIPSLILPYRLLHETILFYLTIPIADFNEQATRIAEDLHRRKMRLGTLDLRIAAIALSIEATLVTRNRRDFEQIPGLAIEDWSVEI